MNLITEDEIKKIIKAGQYNKNDDLKLPKNSMLTPSAKSVISEKKLNLILTDEKPDQKTDEHLKENETDVMKTAGEMAAKKQGRFKLEGGGFLDQKPEHMTQLYGNLLVNKDNKRVKLRGQVDILTSEILKIQIRAMEYNLKGLVSDLQEVYVYITELSRSEVLNEPMSSNTIMGLNHSEIRDMSHHPKKYFGHEHLFNITYEIGEIPVLLNALRALVRSTEIACYEAFKDCDGTVLRSDLIQGYNRLSSVIYILIFKYLDS